MVKDKAKIKTTHGIKLKGNPTVNLTRDMCVLMSGNKI